MSRSKGIGVVLLIQAAIVVLGIVLMGEAFADLSVLNAPIINLLLWTGLISLAALAWSLARRPVHRTMGLVLVIAAVAWFPISLLIFGNARFSGTSTFLWQAWLQGTAALVLGCLASLAASAIAGWRWPP